MEELTLEPRTGLCFKYYGYVARVQSVTPNGIWYKYVRPPNPGAARGTQMTFDTWNHAVKMGWIVEDNTCG